MMKPHHHQHSLILGQPMLMFEARPDPDVLPDKSKSVIMSLSFNWPTFHRPSSNETTIEKRMNVTVVAMKKILVRQIPRMNLTFKTLLAATSRMRLTPPMRIDNTQPRSTKLQIFLVMWKLKKKRMPVMASHGAGEHQKGGNHQLLRRIGNQQRQSQLYQNTKRWMTPEAGPNSIFVQSVTQTENT